MCIKRLTYDDLNEETDQFLYTEKKGRSSLYTVKREYLSDDTMDNISIEFHLEHFIKVCEEWKNYQLPYDEDDITSPNPDVFDDYMIDLFEDNNILLEYQFISGCTPRWVSVIYIDPSLSKERLLEFCKNFKHNDIYKPHIVKKAYETYGEEIQNEHHNLKDYHVFTNKQIEIIEKVWDEHICNYTVIKGE